MKILDFFAVQASGFLHGGGAKGSQHLFSQLKLSGNESILEVGVGTGASLVALKSIWPDLNLVGVEVNEQMLETAKKRLQFCGLKDVTIHKIDPNVSYPFQDASFDLVIVESVLAIQSIEGLEKLLVEIHRILKPRGVLAINETIWLPNQDSEQIRLFNQFCLEHFGIIQSNDELQDIDQWKTFLQEKGWKVKYCEKVENWEGNLSFGWRNSLSKVYSWIEKSKKYFDQTHRRQAQEVKSLEKTV